MMFKFFAERLIGLASLILKKEDQQGIFVCVEKAGNKLVVTYGSYSGEASSSNKITTEEIAPSIYSVEYEKLNERITRETLLADLKKYGNFDSIALTASVETLQKIKSCVISPDLTEDEKGNFLATIGVKIQLYSGNIGVDYISVNSFGVPAPMHDYANNLHHYGIQYV